MCRYRSRDKTIQSLLLVLSTMNSKGLLSTVPLVSILLGGIAFSQGSYASPLRDRVCSLYKGDVAVERKTCKIDYFNSGLIRVYTNNVTLDFELDSETTPTMRKFAGSYWRLSPQSNSVRAVGADAPSIPWNHLLCSE